MKNRKRTKGRRGRRNRAHERRVERQSIETQRLIEENQRRRKAALDRILPRLRRFGNLSEVGICAPRDGNVDSDRRIFYSVKGQERGSLQLKGRQWVRLYETTPWEKLEITVLERLAKIKRWDPIVPKNAMEILAEAFAGLHEDL